jgi:hypothetical protein
MNFSAMFVSLSFHLCVSSEQVLLNHCMHQFPFLQPRVNMFHLILFPVLNAKMYWWVSIQHLKGEMTQRRVIIRVVPEFC